jgi:Fic/DOC family protein
MSDSKQQAVNDFRGRALPEPARPSGYAELIAQYDLKVPLPPMLSAITERHHPVSTENWQLLTPRHQPSATLQDQIEFALKWEGIDLSVLAALFKAVPEQAIGSVVRSKPTGAYTRRLWFLYEWLTARTLDVPDPGKVRAVPVVDQKMQFALSEGTLFSRYKVVNNMPGNASFCPMVRRTEKLDQFAAKQFNRRAREIAGRTHPDIMARAAAFLLLSDSKSSFWIEGEKPPAQRIARWGQIIGGAGSVKLSLEELERLQKIVIGDARFVQLGLRKEGGFVGMHDRDTQEPLPDHISAKAEDLPSLMDGIVTYDRRVLAGGLDPVVAAAALAFGFVYIHPFADGNGRLHRWLIHHVLANAGFNPPALLFPISTAILRQFEKYLAVLQSYSGLLLHFIEWKPTPEGNVQVLNDTADYYRYFDATAHAEFLYECVEQTVEHDLPDEVAHLQAYDRFSQAVQNIVDMPNQKIDLLWHFLRQGKGVLSQRTRTNEFSALSDVEVRQVEKLYADSWERSEARVMNVQEIVSPVNSE